ncbi:hypothetical protein PC116_g15903, partial [Phytophthora cactorum]
MVTLYCVIVGVGGSAFPVDIDASLSVGHLKKAIKAENSATITCDAKDLQLFLGKKDGGWLSSLTEDVKQLKKGEKTALIEALTSENLELQGGDPIYEFLANMETPKAKQIHVLVEVPEGASDAEAKQKAKLTTLAMLLKQCGVVGDLPQKGDFLKLFEWTDGDCGKVMAIKAIDDIVHFTGSRFYVRKEILCVLTNFKNIYQSEFDTGKVVNKQFVLMGSPGTGKSCILALMCFYIAVHHKRPV